MNPKMNVKVDKTPC